MQGCQSCRSPSRFDAKTASSQQVGGRLRGIDAKVLSRPGRRASVFKLKKARTEPQYGTVTIVTLRIMKPQEVDADSLRQPENGAIRQFQFRSTIITGEAIPWINRQVGGSAHPLLFLVPQQSCIPLQSAKSRRR